MNALKIVITAMTLMALIGLVSAGSGNNVPTNADLSGCSNPPWIKAKFELNDDGDDWIELFNNEAIQNDIGDWILAHKNGAYTAYKIPQGTVINAKSFLIFYRNKTSIKLNESEGDIMLYNPSVILMGSVKYNSTHFNNTWAQFPINTSLWRNESGLWGIRGNPNLDPTGPRETCKLLSLTNGWNLVSITCI